jgi:alkanesulfonate monooxygenase SsuD/methylene tetrahydromethanopterin reductase-like flavin-dependent oxidoreductase (luciferase family)
VTATNAGVQVGIGLPTTIPGLPGPDTTILDWARRADAGPFSSLGTIDRLVYGNVDALIALAAAAGATRRIGLLTSVLLAPLRAPAVLAKEAASLDALSGGRLTLGVGVGSRDTDYAAVGVPFAERGRRFDDLLETMTGIWAGEPAAPGIDPIGPPPTQPGGPPLLIGGFGPAAARRVARWGAGYLGTMVDPATASQLFAGATAAWEAAGRTGRPRFVMGLYFALGPDAAERGAAYARGYYAFAPGGMADAVAASVLATPAAIKDAVRAYGAVGVDEICFWPTAGTIDQLQRLEDAVG